MSNVIDNETGRPLADGKVTHIIDWCGRKIGLVRTNKTNSLKNVDVTKIKIILIYSCNNITTTLIQISRLFLFWLFLQN